MNSVSVDKDSIFGTISQIQSDSLGKMGVETANIREYLLDIFNERFSYDPAKDYPEVENYLKDIPVQNLYASLRESLDLGNLPYQCPYTYFLLNAWQRNYLKGTPQEYVQKILDHSPGHIYNPVLASAYTGQLNAVTLKAPDGTRGIVFEDELLNLFQIASIALAGLVLEVESNKLSLVVNPYASNKDENRFRDGFRWLFGAIKAMLTTGSVMLSKPLVPPIASQLEMNLARKISDGMFNFVFAHEQGHIFAQHSELLMGLTDRHTPRRKISEQEEAIERYEKYSGVFPLSPGQAEKFMIRQMIEIEADTSAFLAGALRCNDIDQLDDQQRIEELCVVVGAVSVLPIFNVIENLAVGIAYGGQEYPTDLLGDDDLVQNLCLRTTHPTPNNRLKNAVRSFQDWKKNDPDLLTNGIATYLWMFEELPILINKAYLDWSLSEEDFEEFGLGADALKPQWKGLLDEMPKPFSRESKVSESQSETILCQTISRNQIYDQTYYFYLGDLLLEDENRSDESERYLRRAIEINPGYSDAYHNLGYLLSKNESRVAEAVEVFRDGTIYLKKVVNNFLDDLKNRNVNERFEQNALKAGQYIEISNNLGNLMSNNENYWQDAEQCYLEVIDFIENYMEALSNVSVFVEESLQADSERYFQLAKTFSSLDSFLDTDPDQREAAEEQYKKAKLYLSKPLSNASAFIEENLQEGSELFLQLAQTYWSLGNLLSQNPDRGEEAQECYLKAIELHPGVAPNAYNNLGLLLSNDQSRRAETIDNYRKAIELAPNDADFHFNLGSLLFHIGDNEQEAEEHLRKAIEADSDHVQAYRALAALLSLDENRWSELQIIYQKLLELEPELKNEVMNKLDDLSENEESRRQAETRVLKAIELNPEEASNYAFLAFLLEKDITRIQDAEDHYRKAIELSPLVAEYYVLLGALLLRQNKYEDALKAFQRSSELKQELISPILGLATIYKKINQPAEAIKYATRALEICPETEYYDLACIYSVLENREKFLEFLTLSIEKNPSLKEEIKIDSDLGWIEKDQEFLTLTGGDIAAGN